MVHLHQGYRPTEPLEQQLPSRENQRNCTRRSSRKVRKTTHKQQRRSSRKPARAQKFRGTTEQQNHKTTTHAHNTTTRNALCTPTQTKRNAKHNTSHNTHVYRVFRWIDVLGGATTECKPWVCWNSRQECSCSRRCAHEHRFATLSDFFAFLLVESSEIL